MELYYIYFLPNEPKVGMCRSKNLIQRINQNKWKPSNKNVDGWIVIGAALTKKEAHRIEKEYQTRYDCLDGNNDPAKIEKTASKNRGRKNSVTAINNMKLASVGKNKGYTPWNKGVQYTADQKINLYGHPSGNKGKPSPMAGIEKEIIECPHCGKQGGLPAMTRWHLDNCKYKL
jgi:hypothetical protein